MRELTVRLRFSRQCLGAVLDPDKNDGRLVFARTEDGRVVFLQSWHMTNMKMAAQLLGRHQEAVEQIFFDVGVDGRTRWFKRMYPGRNQKTRFCWHEAFLPGDVIGINCLVPDSIPDDDLLQLFNIAGRYRGLSPWHPGDFGHYVVDKITHRRGRGNEAVGLMPVPGVSAPCELKPLEKKEHAVNQ